MGFKIPRELYLALEREAEEDCGDICEVLKEATRDKVNLLYGPAQ